MPRSHDSLRSLLLRRLWLPLLLVLLADAVCSYLVARYYAEDVYDGWLRDSGMSLTELLHDGGGRLQLHMPTATARMFEWDSLDTVQAEVLAGDVHLYGDLPIPGPGGVHQDSDLHFYDLVLKGQSMRAVQMRPVLANGLSPVTIRIAETRYKRQRLERHLLAASIPLQVFLLALAGIMVWLGVDTAARATNRAAQQLARFEFTGRRSLQPFGAFPQELKPALDAINDLMLRLDQAQQQQQRFVANAAHQLRTPLAAMQVRLESALRENDPGTHQHALSQLLGDLNRLHHLTHQILMLNRSETDSGILRMQRLDLAGLCRHELERQTNRAIASGHDLGYEGPDSGVWIDGEMQLLRELLANLIDNALRYGRPGGVITVGLQDGDGVELRVDDDGPGIPVQERLRVLERFYRYGSEDDGCGLGLAIVGEIANRHDADFAIEQSPSGGTRMTLRFPTAPDPSSAA